MHKNLLSTFGTPSIISATNIFVAFVTQLIILYSITSPDELDIFLKQITIPFFAMGLVFASFREDFFSQHVIYVSSLEKLSFPKSLVKNIFTFSLIIFLAMLFQKNSIEISIIGVLLFFFSSLVQIASSVYKKFYNSIFPALLPSIVSLNVLLLTLIFNFYLQGSVSLVLIYLIPNLLLTYFFFVLFRKYLVFDNKTIKINLKTILHNVFFSISVVIEGYLIIFFTTSDFTHLAFMHRVIGSFNAFLVTFIFFNLKTISQIKKIDIKRLVIIVMVLQALLIISIFIFSMLDFFENKLMIFKLNLDKLIFISYFMMPAGILNAGSYFIIRKTGGSIFSTTDLILIFFIFLTFSCFGIIFGGIYIYVILLYICWLIFFAYTVFKYNKIN